MEYVGEFHVASTGGKRRPLTQISSSNFRWRRHESRSSSFQDLNILKQCHMTWINQRDLSETGERRFHCNWLRKLRAESSEKYTDNATPWGLGAGDCTQEAELGGDSNMFMLIHTRRVNWHQSLKVKDVLWLFVAWCRSHLL